MDLHDATLVSISLDWATGAAHVLFRTSNGSVVLRASGVAHLQCPHLNPWGPSSSVNEVRGPVPREGASVVEIEMQSGDVIVLVAEGFVTEAVSRSVESFQSWSTQAASDIRRDGLGVELLDVQGAIRAEVFRCDRDRTVTVSHYGGDRPPSSVLDWFYAKAAERLRAFEDGSPLPPLEGWREDRTL